MKPKQSTAKLASEPPYITNSYPRILGGERMAPFELPADFDMAYHKKVLASGKFRPTTHEEFVEIITQLKEQLKE